MDKEEIRWNVWSLMEEEQIARFPRPVFHRIPNFAGAERAARRLGNLPEYGAATTIFCSPDSPQRPVREMILKDEKILIMATPKLKKGFLCLKPDAIPKGSVSHASTIRGAFECGQFVEPSELKVDLFVLGSVAVSPDGGRLGKGTGYSDREYSILKDSGGLAVGALAVTTVHDVQIVEEIPRDEWDIQVDVIVTPTRTLRTA
ncbi:MAG: 5-formyltetrahydrofolate cyclo-ligase [Candidatus Bathyarchaeota archaeon]|nr:MAG: 5-formyltetrahydrofolate cyclo-ligase [Candidatus Bathyarchaeota archaeon]